MFLRRIERRRRPSLAMNITRILPFSALLLLAAHVDAQANVQSTRIYLTRPELMAPDLDATGAIVIKSYDGGDREIFEVRIQKVTAQPVHELWIDDGGGTMTFVSNLAGGKSKKYAVDTQKGGTLPFGLTLAELAGRHLEVQVNGEVLLSSDVPAFVLEDKHKFAEENLDVAPGSPNLGAQGAIKVKANDQRGLQWFRIKAKDLGWQSFAYFLWIENDEGEMVLAAPLEQYGKRKGRLFRCTRAGTALPLGALYIDDITGRKIEVRDQNGTTYLQEFVPPLK